MIDIEIVVMVGKREVTPTGIVWKNPVSIARLFSAPNTFSATPIAETEIREALMRLENLLKQAKQGQ